MNKTIERKGHNPRITVCYTPDENQRIIECFCLWTEEKSVYPRYLFEAGAEGNDER